ncbi:endonuclease/exonuclease/phosphatase family protein [Luteibacter aegosomatissinici]|uniref:endonuclease/exonuclease/phosphatase family protein n=1 Tax=Luteibacter aegosomatissinici TaxID=2911539 RepID=UPI001FFAA4AE|nr:endonuclease/exonuclease/phosphatase family protein [Luteibacter aegosomatissinici]UPG93526.1 endonuclease/exonuclease/phosphatase family protein [Luteibacter aegosomatissinici]
MSRLRNLALLAALAAIFAGPAVAAGDLKVMTFNVRTITGPDGPNRWDMRKDLFADTIRQLDPDVIGTQELAQQQGDDTVARLPQFVWFGRDRFGGHKDEHMGIFYRKDRLKLVKSGDFWLSDTPDKVASITWGNVFPRMVNWALFERLSDHKQFYLLDTHFPYRDNDEEARSKSAHEMAEWVKKLPAGTPVVITGDFNTGPDSESHRMLTATFKDAWPTAPKKDGPEETFHNFTGNATKRIDWILYRGLEPKSVRTITISKDGRYPSDHFPVQADFAF